MDEQVISVKHSGELADLSPLLLLICGVWRGMVAKTLVGSHIEKVPLRVVGGKAF